MKLLLERRDTNPNLLDSNGQTPLSHAISGGYQNIVRLLELANVNPRSSDSIPVG